MNKGVDREDLVEGHQTWDSTRDVRHRILSLTLFDSDSLLPRSLEGVPRADFGSRLFFGFSSRVVHGNYSNGNIQLGLSEVKGRTSKPNGTTRETESSGTKERIDPHAPDPGVPFPSDRGQSSSKLLLSTLRCFVRDGVGMGVRRVG